MHFLSCFSALLAWELLKIEVLMIELSVRYQFSLGGTQIQMTTTQKKATDIPHLFFSCFWLEITADPETVIPCFQVSDGT